MFFPDNYEFYCPVKINSGNRALEHLPVELDALNATKPLVITDKKIAKKGLIKRLKALLKIRELRWPSLMGFPRFPILNWLEGL